jgi:hypothetical protein
LRKGRPIVRFRSIRVGAEAVQAARVPAGPCRSRSLRMRAAKRRVDYAISSCLRPVFTSVISSFIQPTNKLGADVRLKMTGRKPLSNPGANLGVAGMSRLAARLVAASMLAMVGTTAGAQSPVSPTTESVPSAAATDPTAPSAPIQESPGCAGPCGPDVDWKKIPRIRPFPRTGNWSVPPAGPGCYSALDCLRGDYLQGPPKYPLPRFCNDASGIPLVKLDISAIQFRGTELGQRRPGQRRSATLCTATSSPTSQLGT